VPKVYAPEFRLEDRRAPALRECRSLLRRRRQCCTGRAGALTRIDGDTDALRRVSRRAPVDTRRARTSSNSAARTGAARSLASACTSAATESAFSPAARLPMSRRPPAFWTHKTLSTGMRSFTDHRKRIRWDRTTATTATCPMRVSRSCTRAPLRLAGIDRSLHAPRTGRDLRGCRCVPRRNGTGRARAIARPARTAARGGRTPGSGCPARA
jgi:hypothetical protein